MGLVVGHLGWVDIDLGHSTVCLLRSSAWADGNMAELAVQLGKIVEHLNQSQPNPCDKPPAPPCKEEALLVVTSLSWDVPPSCPATQLIQPHSHLLKVNQADSGMTQINVNSTQVGHSVDLKKKL